MNNNNSASVTVAAETIGLFFDKLEIFSCAISATTFLMDEIFITEGNADDYHFSDNGAIRGGLQRAICLLNESLSELYQTNRYKLLGDVKRPAEKKTDVNQEFLDKYEALLCANYATTFLMDELFINDQGVEKYQFGNDIQAGLYATISLLHEQLFNQTKYAPEYINKHLGMAGNQIADREVAP